jgi:hypothetical protein
MGIVVRLGSMKALPGGSAAGLQGRRNRGGRGGGGGNRTPGRPRAASRCHHGMRLAGASLPLRGGGGTPCGPRARLKRSECRFSLVAPFMLVTFDADPWRGGRARRQPSMTGARGGRSLP